MQLSLESIRKTTFTAKMTTSILHLPLAVFRVLRWYQRLELFCTILFYVPMFSRKQTQISRLLERVKRVGGVPGIG